MKKIISLLCLAAMLLTAVACGNETVGDDTTAAPVLTQSETTVQEETTELSAFDKLEKKSQGGYEFRIFYIQTDNCYTDFESEGDDGALLSTAVYKRNVQVEEALDVKIVCSHDGTENVLAAIRKQGSSGDADYDMYGVGRTVFPLSYSGMLYNIASIESLDLTQEYWDQSWVGSMKFNDSLYGLVGDMALSTLLLNSCICFNKKLFTDLGLEEPYTAVREGKWTYEAMVTTMQSFGGDLNGDGKMSYTDDNYALTGWLTEAGYGMFYGSGFTFVTRTGTGEYELSFDSDKLQSIIDTVVAVWTNENVYFNSSGQASQHSYPFSVFSSGRGLLLDTALSKVGTFLSEMEDDYGIIPEPKYNEDQESYYSYVGYSIPIAVLSSNCPNPEQVGTIMEALSAASYDSVTPQMLELVTKTRNVRDADSSEMINIIIRNKIFDPVHWFDVPGYGSFSRTMITSGSTSVASFVKSYDKNAQKQWKNIITQFENQKS